jgi:ABC-2 type transport system ATP-binding protein
MTLPGAIGALSDNDRGAEAPPERQHRAVGPVTAVVEELARSYGDVRALDGVSFRCHAGEVLGVLGPNGAGKTTLIEILEGLRRPDSGRATVLGADACDPGQRSGLRDRIGIAMQRTELPQRVTVEELLRIYAAFYLRPRPVEELIERLGLEEKRGARVGTLSGGQLQRLAVGLALLGRPDLLFLDEPTSQLDPQSRRAVWELVGESRAAGSTVILTTHQMDEAEQLCDRIAVLDHGRILALGTPADLVERHAPGCMVRFITDAGAPLDLLAPGCTVQPVGDGQRAVAVDAASAEPVLERLLSARAAGRLRMAGLRVEQKTLEDVFINLTGRRIRE